MKIHVFSTIFNNKSKHCGWNDAKCLFICYFICEAQKITIMAILTWFLILDKIQDGDHCWPRHRPPAAPPPIKCVYLILLRRSRLSTKGKIVSKYFNISNTRGWISIHPPPPPACTTVGVWICVCVYVRGLIWLIYICRKFFALPCFSQDIPCNLLRWWDLGYVSNCKTSCSNNGEEQCFKSRAMSFLLVCSWMDSPSVILSFLMLEA